MVSLLFFFPSEVPGTLLSGLPGLFYPLLFLSFSLVWLVSCLLLLFCCARFWCLTVYLSAFLWDILIFTTYKIQILMNEMHQLFKMHIILGNSSSKHLLGGEKTKERPPSSCIYPGGCWISHTNAFYSLCSWILAYIFFPNI